MADTNAPSESFSGKPEVHMMLESLREEIGIDNPEAFAEAVDARLHSDKEVIFKDAQDARAELLDEIRQSQIDGGIDTQEEVTLAIDALERVLQEETVEGLMDIEDLRTMPLEELKELERDKPGILLFAFSSWSDNHDAIDLAQFTPYTEPQEGLELEIDFRGNQEAYWRLGASDLIPSEVRTITVRSARNGSERTSTRRVGLQSSEKTGFFDENGYMPIFTGDTVILGGVNEEILTYKEVDEETGKVTWNDEKYQADHGQEDQAFLRGLWEETYHATYSGQELTREDFQHVRESQPQNVQEMEQLLQERPEWFTAAQSACEHYANRFGLAQMDPSVIFGFIRFESNFNPNAVNASSDATGLGQFIQSTWLSFYSKNQATINQLLESQGLAKPRNRAEKLALRKNPVLNIYATTWLTAYHAKKAGIDRVTTDNPGAVTELYYYHHEGLSGGRQLHAYVVEGRNVQLKHWQTSPSPESYYATIRAYGKRVEGYAGSYQGQLNDGAQERAHEQIAQAQAVDDEIAAVVDNAVSTAPTSVPSVTADSTEPSSTTDAPTPTVESRSISYTEALDEAAERAEIPGQTLYIGSSSAVGFTQHVRKQPGDIVQAKSGRRIDDMAQTLRDLDPNALRQMDRVVILGGIKNTAGSNEHRMNVAEAALRDMVAYIRETSPHTKIYVSELSPWQAHKKYNPAIEAFNTFISSGELGLDGVVPLYSASHDGNGGINENFGSADGLHLRRADRLAGLVTHYVRQKESDNDSTATAVS